MDRFVTTKGKAEVLHLDDFGRYLEAKRAELRVEPRVFWAEYLLALGGIVALVGFMVAFVLAAPVISAFLRAHGV